MPRANLGQLLGNVDGIIPSMLTEPPLLPIVAPASEVPTAHVETATPAASPAADELVVATYLRFVRKDTRLRDEQLEALTAHARRLNRKRRSTGPRVTENTLIRVAVDLLLDRIEQASGDDEAALLKSVRR